MTTTTIQRLHPDDVLFFNEVRSRMRTVARAYQLPLLEIQPFPMPKTSMADRKGDCAHDGVIRIVMRCTVEGEWCEEPRSPESVWDTAAHELAHLRHPNHGHAFHEFYLELRGAIEARDEDHRTKLLKKLVKMQAQREDAARRASEGHENAQEEAEAFASMINKMLIENELNPTDIDFARASDQDPVIEIKANLIEYGVKKVKQRVGWQSLLARVVADAHLCSYLIQSGTNNIWFVGTKSHATVAEYVFGTLVKLAEKMSEQARRDFRNQCRRDCNYTKMDGFPEAYGYREAWLNGFISRMRERFVKAREEAVKDAQERQLRDLGVTDLPPGTECTALIRLSGALVKVRKYINDKYSRGKKVSSLTAKYRHNERGFSAGRAAADKMTIGRRAVTGGAPKKLLN